MLIEYRGEVLPGYAPGLPNLPGKASRNAASFSLEKIIAIFT